MTEYQGLAQALGETADLMEMMAAEPLQAAAMMEQWAADLLALAAELRQAGGAPISSPEGVTDKVFIQVIGPDGAVKATGGN